MFESKHHEQQAGIDLSQIHLLGHEAARPAPAFSVVR